MAEKKRSKGSTWYVEDPGAKKSKKSVSESHKRNSQSRSTNSSRRRSSDSIAQNGERYASASRKKKQNDTEVRKRRASGTRLNSDRRRELNANKNKQRVLNNNAAKSVVRSESMKERRKRKTKESQIIGLALTGIELIASLVFLLSLLVLGILPDKYMVIVAGVLCGIWLILFVGQLLTRKRAIGGKIISVIMSVVLFIASFYVYQIGGTVEDISGGTTKLDKIVVVVLADDSAETIQDAADYNFAVQYKLKGDQIKATVSAINEELGSQITTTEYESVREQAESLLAGNTRAMIYSEAYASVLDDGIEGGFSNNVKVIYSQDIETLVLNESEDIEVENTTFTVYISGIDVYGAIETNSRSDVNILAEVNPTTRQILLVTTPRDYYVEIPGISGGMKDKLTHAGIYGVDVSMATLDNLYETESEFYARVNFTSLVQMVDALGGIDVISDQTFTTSEESGCIVNIVAGENHLNGEQALAFCRERKNVDGGDNARGVHQQAVITAMIQKVISPAILMGANDLLNSVSGNVDTNMSTQQIQNLIKSQLDNPQPWRIKSLAAEGTNDSQACYSSGSTPLYVMQPNADSVAAIIQAFNAVENGEIFEDSAVAE